MNFLIVNLVSVGTKNLSMLSLGDPIEENVGLKSGRTSSIGLLTLKRPYEKSSLDPTVLIFLYCLTLRLLTDLKLLNFN